MSIQKFCDKFSLEEEGKDELIQLLNKSLIEISRGILETHKPAGKDEQVKKDNIKRFKSKKAEDYAEEHGLSLDDFDNIMDVSKKDVENKVRDITKNNKKTTGMKSTSKVDTESNIKKTGKQRVICSGINKKGEACKSTGTIKPDGAKKMYCFRHSEDFRSFECDSDSSDEENDNELVCKSAELEEEEFEKQ